MQKVIVMANKEEHIEKALLIGGPILCLLLFMIDNNPSMFLLTVLLSLGMLVLGAVLPDILEPPTNPFHRSTFHSKLILIIVGSLGIISIIITFLVIANWITLSLCGLFIGYVIHLAQDSQTRIG